MAQNDDFPEVAAAAYYIVCRTMRDCRHFLKMLVFGHFGLL